MIVAQTDAATDVLVSLLQYGPLGLFVLAIITGLVWAKPSVQRIIQERDDMAACLDRELELRHDTLAALRTKLDQLSAQHTASDQQIAELRRLLERLESR